MTQTSMCRSPASWICSKHLALNPKVKRGIEIEHEKAPRELVERLNLPTEFFAIAYRRLSDTNKNKNTNPKRLFSPGLSTRFPQVQSGRRTMLNSADGSGISPT